MPRKRQQYGRMEIQLDPDFHREIERLAAEIRLSAPAWCQMAIASYYSKWQSPRKHKKSKTGADPDANGRWCDRCCVPASACTHPEQHKGMGEWREDEDG